MVFLGGLQPVVAGGAQIKDFDVFYRSPVVPGFHVIGSTSNPMVLGFVAVRCPESYMSEGDAAVIGFHVVEEL